jgi:sugar phosphate isomerase/epimerase
MKSPVAVQLYSLRESLAKDFDGTVDQLAETGYLGVETAGFPGTTAEAAGRLFERLGLAVAGAHVPLPFGDQKNEVLDTLAALNCRLAVCPYLPQEQFASLSEIRRACDRLNEAQAVFAENGFQFGYHNHWWEFEPVEGRLAHDWMSEYLHPDVFFEIDTYWVQAAGQDPAAVIRRLGVRAPLLHLKDGPAIPNQPMVALGSGVMDIPAVVAAGAGATQWLIVELDACATDMLGAVKQSYHYLIEKGLARGREN